MLRELKNGLKNQESFSLETIGDLAVIMPNHDVKLIMSSKNPMIYIPVVAISFENRVEPADIWIMEDTPEKRKQSVWGEKNIEACPVNKSMDILIQDISDDNLYIVRMIDENGMYYEAYGVEITDGQSIVVNSTEDGFRTVVNVYDVDGNPVNEYEMFVARL